MDEDISLDILYTDEHVHDELYTLVRQGSCSQLNNRLQQLPNSIHYLRMLRQYDQELVSLLMVAALNGYDDIVRVLLTYDKSIHQVELKGDVIISKRINLEGATALYCACYRGHFKVAKTLIELVQANVNQDTNDYPYCPLLVYAARMNRLDIVRFLIENRYSDINETKSTDGDECTALIWATLRGHTALTKYLIENGADINYICSNEHLVASTPLACAVLGGYVCAARLLCNAGADTDIINKNGDNLLVIAVRNKRYSTIDFLLKQSIYNVDDLELTACSMVKLSSSIERMNEALKLLKFTLRKRKSMSIEKNCIAPIAAYDNQQECQTVDELNGIKDNRHRIFLETLLIRERIALSRNDINILKILHDYGDQLVHDEEFDKCLDLWIHMFYIYQQMKINTILHRFVWLFCRMLTADQPIPVQRFLQVCQLVFEPSQKDDKYLTTFNALFLVIIATKIIEQNKISKDDQLSIYSWVKDLCRYGLTNGNGATLLHLCVDNQSNKVLSFRPEDTVQYLKFPHEAGLRLLLVCGSRWLDLDAMESTNGDTPLHLVCNSSNDPQIIQILLNSGCHIDCINKHGKTPMNYARNLKIKSLLIPKPIPSNLKCLCARLIAQQQLNTDCLGASNSRLNKFLDIHGRHSTPSICSIFH